MTLKNLSQRRFIPASGSVVAGTHYRFAVRNTPAPSKFTPVNLCKPQIEASNPPRGQKHTVSQ
jgi:hypothetical protein